MTGSIGINKCNQQATILEGRGLYILAANKVPSTIYFYIPGTSFALL